MTAYSVAAGTTQSARLTLAAADTLQVDGTLSVLGNTQSVRFTTAPDGAEIRNDGLIENTASGGRAIRFESGVGATLSATLDNGGDILSVDDAVQIQAGSVAAGTLTITNAAGSSIVSNQGQALDLASTTGDFLADIDNDGSLLSLVSDGLRIGATLDLGNAGTIQGGSASGYVQGADGIQLEDNASGTIRNMGGGAILGDRHGINMGEGSLATVTNEAGASIIGGNGSGIGSDGTATVVNYGIITGSFADAAGSDVNGSTPGVEDGGGPDGVNDGDGDGIDIDFRATIENHGVIRGLGAGGTGSDGLPNTAEGIAAGGGEITNVSGARIYGAGLGILIDDSSQGNAPFLTTIENAGLIQGGSGIAIKIVSELDDTIVNSGRILSGGGTAIQFGSGDNTLGLETGSSIRGTSLGGDGTDTLDYSDYGSSARVLLDGGRATGTGGISGFEIVKGSAFADSVRGDAGENQVLGGAGDDRLFGGGGDDTLTGGAGTDVLRGDGGADSFVFDVLPPAGEKDRIVDFSHGEDTLAFDSSTFTALSGGTLSNDAFALGTATTVDQRIIYDSAKGNLSYDADGSGTAHEAVLIATLLGKPVLAASDVLVV
ncbi:M10 family metallopeptidase C-terminal domain-containing protein [Methylobacterium sp. 77]|uniref:M10 family metallopeptidase C-terminal domain-containing protein n=1 Tax=Methylobacterium sp. 77 TaxID=1101192 RepID=UPI0003768CFE|nr:M10 family metallopeptidase C-terminal domain-containing protein [Methylobacterium sp. 77]